MKRILFLILPFLPYLASAQVAKDTVTVLTIADIPAGAIRDTTNFTFVQDNAFKKATFDSLAKYTRVKLLATGAITSAELANALSNETGTGAAVFGTSPTISGATISGGSINNTPIGASTANTGAFTTVTASSTATATKFIPTGGTATGDGMYLPAVGTLAFSANGIERIRIANNSTAATVVGIGTTPFNDWQSNRYAIQFGTSSLHNFNNVTLSFSQNHYVNSSAQNVYADMTKSAGLYIQLRGSHGFYGVPTNAGNTNNVISWDPILTIAPSRRVGIGLFGTLTGDNNNDITAYLHIRASDGSAGYAPLKFTNGTLLGTPEAGAVEYNTGKLYFTGTAGAGNRREVGFGLSGSATLDFLSTNAQNSRDLTITVTGASDGDVVSLGVPNAAVNANTCYTAWVSAANTVTVRFNNYSSGSVDPASGTFKVFVIKN